MGIEEFFDVDLDLDEAGLDKLDKLAEKAEKDLERIQKANQKAGGALGGKQTTGLPKAFEKQQEKETLTRIQKLGKDGKIDLGSKGAPIQKVSAFDELVKEQDGLKKLMEAQLGPGQAGRALGILQNPAGLLKGLGKGLPIIGGVLIAKDLIMKVMVEQTKRGGLLDRFFRDTIESMNNALRQKEESQAILSGFTQEILTTQTGQTNPRDAYNTFDVFNTDKETLENDYAVRNRSGFD